MHSRILLGLLILALAFTSGEQSAQPATAARPLVLEHVTVIDATGAPAKPDMTVVITSGRISEIRKSGSIQVPQGAQTVDVKGEYLIPGLWDMHTHILTDKGPDILLPLLVANGVTGAREMGNDNDVPIEAMDRMRKEIEQRMLIGPRILMAGHILDGPKPVLPSNVALTTEAQARQTVIDLKKSGADFIKVYTALPRHLYFAI
jgi:imidazolonepropionase-like amidohydrolase